MRSSAAASGHTVPRRLWLIAFGIAAFSVAIRIPTLSEPRWYYDEGVFTTVAWAMSKGMPLYTSVYDLQPPGIYWLYELMIELGAGQHHVVVQIASSLFVATTAVLTFEIARRFVPIWPAAMAGLLTGFALSIPTLDGDLLNVELVALPFFLASLLLAFNSRLLIVFASGCLLGLALVTRPSFLVDSLVLLVPLLGAARREVRLLLAGLGLALALLVAGLVLWLQGSEVAFATVVVPSDHAYLLRANGGTLTPVLVRLAVLGIISLVALVRAGTFWGRLLAVWVPASLAGASLTPIEYSHFVHEAIPPLAIAIAMVAARFRRRWLAAPVAAAVLVICCEALLILPLQQTAQMVGVRAGRPLQHNFGYEELPAYYANWFAFASGARSESEYAARFPVTPVQAAEVARLLSFGSPPDARLQVLGAAPWIYIETGLLPATPYLNTNTSSWLVPSGDEFLHRSLRGGCADLVVAVSQLDYWQTDLSYGGYIAVQGAPWPTFQLAGPRHPCSALS